MINIDAVQKIMLGVCEFNATPGEGYTRIGFSKEDLQARDYLINHMGQLGLNVKVDSVGNIFGTLQGSDPSRKPIWVGSHIDTVIHGGMFDGLAGVACALEIIRSIKEEGFDNKASIVVVVFAEEEGSGFGSTTTGSKAIAGHYSLEDLRGLKNRDGLSYYEALKKNDINPDNLPSDLLKPDQIEAMFELHIEQSVYLDSCQTSIGIVKAIAGINVLRVTLDGVANHAGATPMNLRKDPLLAASKIIDSIEEMAVAHESESIVATVGHIDCKPNASNVIPGEVSFTIDIRDIHVECIDDLSKKIRLKIEEIASERHIVLKIETIAKCDSSFLSEELADLIAKNSDEMKLPYKKMNSGAVHDAAVLVPFTKVGFIFVPSIDGFSHSPLENTKFSDIEKGCQLLCKVIKDVAK